MAQYPKGWGIQGERGLYPEPDIRTLTNQSAATTFAVGDLALVDIRGARVQDLGPGAGSIFESVDTCPAHNQNQLNQVTGIYAVYMGKKKANLQTEALAVGETGEFLLFGIFDPFVINPDGDSTGNNEAAPRGRPVWQAAGTANTLQVVGDTTKVPGPVKCLGTTLEAMAAGVTGGNRARTSVLFNGYGSGTIPAAIQSLDGTSTVAALIDAMDTAGLIITQT